jgi:carbamate kinase
MEEGHFAEGSMKPKIEASLNFLENSSNGSAALITDPGNIARALRRETGTWIRRV